MAAFLNDNVLDYGLNWLGTATARLDICSAQPATYAEATTTYTLGTADPSFTGPADDTSGRKITCDAISNGTVTASGTAGFWALSDGASVLIAAYSLSSTQVVTSGNTFTLTAFKVSIPDPS